MGGRITRTGRKPYPTLDSHSKRGRVRLSSSDFDREFAHSLTLQREVHICSANVL